MNRNLSLLALSGTLALGAFAGFELSERSSAQVTNTLPAATAQATPSTANVFDSGRARTESEANTVQVVKDRQDGLVYVSVTESGQGGPQVQQQQFQDPFGFGIPGMPGGGGNGGMQKATGSGFFVDAQGDIITNNHVVEGASEITIRLHGNKQTYKAKVIGRAPDFDLALIRPEGLPQGAIKPIPLGDSSQLDVGLKAIAMGAPFGLDFSVSEGIISSLDRTVPVGAKEVDQQVIQTDAAINPGNSGGPLLNSAGQVIGVNTQILTGGSEQSAGVGFAIPVNTVKRLLPQLQAGGELRTPTLGIQFTDLSALPQDERQKLNLPATGALVQQVYPGSPAAQAGLRGSAQAAAQDQNGQMQNGQPQIATDGDIIVAVDGQPITEGADLSRAVIGKRIGDTLRLTVQRNGQTRDVTVNLQAFTIPGTQQ
ncbi:PDZ domain-containing protein [Deinococcus metallilatus]|uniref:PDZ domain-containing protein n=1 Tax=Deinococcus metallilatus TaxID=1211322 RepID=A0AAJ5F2T7_9DEIO|nr:trypsin-like peptidase domain-containing protein [Deinococcus metallilatus]MBB5297387.1 S1-C subfamily serine protease [Deinococcus metallilatus]QBY08795.1 PDZ domain-containing protein [Deinococcus metallilatus]RXJ10676.1 PDZ domain-containing protein [Deinococcus metallilatus]TLK26646.1 PDZ domain-containing protein [Deinococcus metallilatus]GMA17036.1 serine protease [Deinococcus metallilatus]